MVPVVAAAVASGGTKPGSLLAECREQIPQLRDQIVESQLPVLGRRIQEVRQVGDDVAKHQARPGVRRDRQVNRAGVDHRAKQVQMDRGDVNGEDRGRRLGRRRAKRARGVHAGHVQGRRVQQVDDASQHVVSSRGADTLKVDQAAHVGEQVTEQCAVARLTGDSDHDRGGPCRRPQRRAAVQCDLQAEQIEIDRLQDELEELRVAQRRCRR